MMHDHVLDLDRRLVENYKQTIPKSEQIRVKLPQEFIVRAGTPIEIPGFWFKEEDAKGQKLAMDAIVKLSKTINGK